MGRLTENQSAGYDLKVLNGEWCNQYCDKQKIETCNECGIYEAIQKLAEYEDLEEQGLLLRLPCPKGTTVYVIEEDYNEPYSKYFYINECAFEIGMLDYIGKDIFLTKPEAEEALEKMQEGE